MYYGRPLFVVMIIITKRSFLFERDSAFYFWVKKQQKAYLNWWWFSIIITISGGGRVKFLETSLFLSSGGMDFFPVIDYILTKSNMFIYFPQKCV